MSSFFDSASLVQIPSGYDVGTLFSVKPIDGSGDLTFTRSNDTATRVGPDGLIEKVRTNLVLQSNTFSNAAWTKTNSTVAIGQTGYDGTNNAWLLSKSGAYGRVEQSLATTGLEAFSVYVKAGNSNYTEITSSAGPYLAVNLTNGSIVAQSGVTPVVTSIGSGWYRISIAYTKAASNAWRVIAGDAGSSSSAAGSSGTIIIQAAQAESGDIATDYIATTTTAVSVGPVANLPRLDYSGGATCPKLLLEGQRINLCPQSENFGAWVQSATLVTNNQTTSPDGYVNADKVTASLTGGSHFIQFTGSAVGDDGAISVFAKADTNSFLQLANPYSGAIYANFDIATGVVGTKGTSCSVSGIEDYGNGWYRCWAVFDNTGFNSHTHRHYMVSSASAGFGQTWTPTSDESIYLYGNQWESGSYATSYIPTLSAASTRGADSCSKTGISSLIGSEAGTLYLEVAALADDLSERRFALSNGTSSNVARVGFTGVSNRIIAVLYNGANQCVLTYNGADITQTNKIAFTWSVNDFALFVNGVKRSSDVFGTTFAANTLTELQFNEGDGAGSDMYGKFQQILLFKTRQTDAQLAELTA